MRESIAGILILLFIIGTVTICSVYGSRQKEADSKRSYDAAYEDGYLEACKDIAKGKPLSYELKELPGGERKWIKRGETK